MDRAVAPCGRVRALRSDLRACMVDGLLYSAMVGVAELYIPAFVEALGLGPVSVGLIATVPLMIGAAAQLGAPAILRRMNSYPKFVGGCAYVQGAMFVPLAIVALTAHWTLPFLREHDAQWVMTALVFLLASVYFAAGLGCGPAWVTLTGKIFPPRVRANYFARRLRWLQLAQLFSILLHGILMSVMAGDPTSRSGDLEAGRMNPAITGFAGIFLVAFLMRMGSGWFLSRYSEPKVRPREEQVVPWRAFYARLWGGHDGRYILFAGMMNAAALVANPFFNPYMLDLLHLRERTLTPSLASIGSAYAFFLAAAYLGRVLAVPHVGRFVQRHGAFRVLATGSLAIIPIPVLWLLTDDLWMLLGFQVLAGAAASTFEYAAFMMYFEAVKPHERTSVITQFQFVNESCKAGGSLVGAGLLRYFGKDAGAYAVVFWASSLARLAMLPLLSRVAKVKHRPEEITSALVGEPVAEEPMVTEPRK